ncbi:MAG: hypothetical protein COU33_00275 [Candidatus Magasanikbacteria bacterium CG10_big_fil_rev_8_21_14_0_10_43_6]|uniref:Uncharacterized protein n=1 Tax=Candidatus Magasanikbacteria bacterium CG10_big_fil_rev_8_21_14_0_10_43_6 TaxID=1974650 RepID=A0A2M6W2F4_9BACT|nr:MAG: hypothetical protein COU33_00275 [Candidatus Magasanikbacteria bacterium CG10_big_fil_rev_8_21_14_0_10_43_6]
MNNYSYCTKSLPTYLGQAFLFKERTSPYQEHSRGKKFMPIWDPTGNQFVPLARLHRNLPKELEEPLLHISALVNYELSFGWPGRGGKAPAPQTIWQHLHTLGLIALVDSTMQRMLLVLKHYAAITRRPFFDFSNIKEEYSKRTYTIQTKDGADVTVSDVFLTILTTNQAITFFRKIHDVSVDEQYIMKYVLEQMGPLFLHGEMIPHVTRPIFMRYIHVKERIGSQEDFWQEDMNAIIYF